MSGSLAVQAGIAAAQPPTATPLIACPDCAAIQRLPPAPPGCRLQCWQCHSTLERTTGRSLDGALACALGTLLLLFTANAWPLLSVSFLGIERQSYLDAGITAFWQQQRPILACAVLLQAVLLPFLRFGLLSATLGALRLGRDFPWLGAAFRWSEELDQWAMPDVFLIGLAIGYSRVAPFLPVHIGAGGYCLLGAAFLAMLTRASLERRATWRLIRAPAEPPQGDRIACTVCDVVLPGSQEGARCPRCRARLSRRRPYALRIALALSLAALLLYPVANLYPMTVQDRLGSMHQHTIFTGVVDLVQAGLWPLAVLVFTVSIGIPLTKLLALFWCFLSVWRRSPHHLRLKTRVYRAVDDLGRWSNLDVYTIAVFVPLMHIAGLVQVHSGNGASAFLSIIVLTMFASRIFDPRLMWDAAEARR
jgi:paraquat-inducible protein A